MIANDVSVTDLERQLGQNACVERAERTARLCEAAGAKLVQ
jgi:hypothetical protein